MMIHLSFYTFYEWHTLDKVLEKPSSEKDKILKTKILYKPKSAIELLRQTQNFNGTKYQMNVYLIFGYLVRELDIEQIPNKRPDFRVLFSSNPSYFNMDLIYVNPSFISFCLTEFPKPM